MDNTQDANHPHSLQAERALLAAVMDIDASGVIAEGVKAEWFFSKIHSLLFESAKDVFDAGEDIDMLSVSPVLAKKLHDEREDADANTILCDLPTGSIVWRSALKTVRNKWIQRSMIHSTREMLEALQAPLASLDDIKEAIQEPSNAITSLTLSDEDKTAKEEITEFLEEKIKEMKGEVEKIPDDFKVYTGMKSLENAFGYIDRRRKDNNIIIAAPSSRGKSSLKRQIMVHNLFKHKDWICVGFLLESSKEDWWHNTACSYAKIDTRCPLNHPSVVGKKQKLYVKCMEMLKEETDKRLFLFDSPASISDVTTKCREIVAKCGQIDILCVDYIQILNSEASRGTRESEVAAMSGGIQRLQKSLKCVTFSGTQLNEDGKARESRAIFNDATIFWRIERPEKDDRGQTQEEGQDIYYQTVKQEKCRNGILTTIGIDFCVTHQTMTDHF